MNDQEILDLMRAMVRAPSYPGIARQEEGTALALRAYLEKHGIPCELVEVREGRPNLMASLAGPKPGRHLLLCGHMDTVPPNDGSSVDFLSAHIENGRMFGRATMSPKRTKT